MGKNQSLKALAFKQNMPIEIHLGCVSVKIKSSKVDVYCAFEFNLVSTLMS